MAHPGKVTGNLLFEDILRIPKYGTPVLLDTLYRQLPHSSSDTYADLPQRVAPDDYLATLYQSLSGPYERQNCVSDDQPFAPGEGVRLSFTSDLAPIRGHQDIVTIDEHFGVVLTNFVSNCNLKGSQTANDGLVVFQFRFEGASEETYSNSFHVNVTEPQIAVIVYPRGTDIELSIAAGTKWRTITICIHPDYLYSRLRLSGDELPEDFQQALSGSDQEFYYSAKPLTLTMVNLLSQLENTRHSGTLRRVFTEAIALELLCEAIDSLRDKPPTEQCSVLINYRDAEHLIEAREILENEYRSPPTLSTLARRVGLNRRKLAYGFKQRFGCTVWQYCFQLRMKEATELLQTRKYTIAEVARRVGYSDPGSFSKIFKAQFGKLPSDFIRP